MDVPPVRDVSAWPVADVEAMGGDSNVWLRDPDDETWLFKPNRIQRNGQEQGEDWAEALACSIARLLGIPAAYAEVAVRGSARGALSRNIVSSRQRSEGWELQAGLVLLGSPDAAGGAGGGRRAAHTVDAVMRLLEDVEPPTHVAGLTAQQTFAGYLVLDALIANQDRHEENWAVLVRPSAVVELAPTYDHGAALGFQLSDEARSEVLVQPGVHVYAARAKGKKMGEGRATLLDLALAALRVSGGPAADRWLGRLGDLTDAALVDAVTRTPRMSDPVRTFCSSLLIENRRRLLDAQP